jgi:hypothetical protein
LGNAFGGNVEAIKWKAYGRAFPGTMAGSRGCRMFRAAAGAELGFKRQKIAFTSRGTPVCGRRDRSIRKKIIGHGMSIFGGSIDARDVLLDRLRVFPVLHQPASQHSRRVFLHPQVKKSANFLA